LLWPLLIVRVAMYWSMFLNLFSPLSSLWSIFS
jgi:hypothetical protein